MGDMGVDGLVVVITDVADLIVVEEKVVVLEVVDVVAIVVMDLMVKVVEEY